MEEARTTGTVGQAASVVDEFNVEATTTTTSVKPSPFHADRHTIFANYYTFIFDADGVLWCGEKALPGAAALFDQLLMAGKRIIIGR